MRQMAARSGRPPRPGPAGKGRKAGGDVRPLPITRPRSYAAIDLGTNNFRRRIALPQNAARVVIEPFSRIVRIGDGLHGSGRISDAANTRPVDARSDVRRSGTEGDGTSGSRGRPYV